MTQLPPLASVDAFAAWLGQEVSALDAARAGALLDAASALVRGESGHSWADLTTVPQDVIPIVLQVAARVYRNPEGFVSEGTGPFSASRGNDAANGLYLTEWEKRVLQRYAPAANNGGLFVVHTAPQTEWFPRTIGVEYADGRPAGDWDFPYYGSSSSPEFPRRG